MARRPRGGRKDYARTDRVGELLRQIIAETLDRIDDPRLTHVTITGVDVDNELNQAVVFFDPLDPDDIDEAAEAFVELRGRLKSAIGSQAHIRRVPDLEFSTDHGVQSGGRVEEILAGLDIPEESGSAPGSDPIASPLDDGSSPA